MSLPLGPHVAARDVLLERSRLAPFELDRLALALGFSVAADERLDPAPGGESAPWARIDEFDDGPAFGPLLDALGAGEDRTARLAGLLQRGFDELIRLFRLHGEDWQRTVVALLARAPGAAPIDAAGVAPIDIEVGRTADGGPVMWRVNGEGGTRNNANTRLAGAPGAGKSQCLLYLLDAIGHEAPDCGLIVLDYKGDLSTDAEFIRRTRAAVIRPADTPIPVNPFQLPAAISPKLAPRAFAEVFLAVSPHIGVVQLEILTRAMELAYAEAQGDPTLAQVRDAVASTYEELDRGPDSVLANLRSLAELGLFAERSERPLAEVFGARWVIDLSGIGPLRDFVAFVLLQFLNQAAQGLGDAAFDRTHGTRRLRGIVAVDEAHYYLRGGRCMPILELIRIGRSKGVPIFLSSQSLEDFRNQTELNEFLPNTFLMRHGVAQDARALAGALGLASLAAARRLSERITALDQFTALTPLAPEPVRLHPFFESVPTP